MLFYMADSSSSSSDSYASISSLWLLSLSAELYGLTLGGGWPLVAFHPSKRSSFLFDGNFWSYFQRFHALSFSGLLFVKKQLPYNAC